MKRNIKNIAIAGVLLAGMTSCGDYLNTKSPSRADAEFVFSNSITAQAALDGVYDFWRTAMVNNVFCNAEFYGLDAAGSDIEKNPEAYASQTRHIPLSFYEGGSAASSFEVTGWNKLGTDAYTRLYAVVGAANNVVNAVQSDEDTYNAIMAGDQPTALSQLYGEAVCLRAVAYRELIRYYGDVPYSNQVGAPVTGFTSRCYIYDKCISELEAVAPKMTAVSGSHKEKFSSTFAYALLGRMCLEAAGFQLYRDDVAPVDGNGNALSLLTDYPDGWQYTNPTGSKYARRSDYMQLIEKAQVAFENCLDNLGDAKFGNDYSTFFTQLHGADNSFADESIYEYPLTQGGGTNCERPYAFGRPAKGNGSNAFPCKSYGQTRIHPAFYYGMFDPKDVRRDLSVAVTVSNGDGTEILTNMTPGNCLNGGLALNKYDENRQGTIWTAKQRKSGINIPYMRVSEIYLGLAEALAAQGKNTDAAVYYNKTHQRAGLEAASSVTLEQVIDERGFEFAGEGDRRWTLIRTGYIGKKISALKTLTAEMINGLESDGYYTFDNGNTISNTIYYKMVTPGEIGLSSRLIGAAGVHEGGYEPSTDAEAAQFPGWRGQHDWHKDGVILKDDGSVNKKVSYYGSDLNSGQSNLCIRGLFSHLDEAPEGYTSWAWGSTIVNNKVEYLDYVFKGWDYHTAPLYLVPFNETECTSSGITNGYGFKLY
ncbi:MAG: RagB/SusD family nutrient uptake outer membrane protein [Prevotella sp.]|nr:RagB/SusD family nutrient uptake outer membrane protein [Prevotella sp.]